MFNDELTMEEYASYDRLQRIIARTQVSIASVQGATATATTGARYGLGFQTQLIDGRDPRDIATARCRIAAME